MGVFLLVHMEMLTILEVSGSVLSGTYATTFSLMADVSADRLDHSTVIFCNVAKLNAVNIHGKKNGRIFSILGDFRALMKQETRKGRTLRPADTDS